MGKVPSSLLKFVKSIKDEDKTKRSISAFLLKTIDDYCKSEEFDRYLERHAHEIPKYLEGGLAERLGRWRASAAGKCLQAQALSAAKAEWVGMPYDFPYLEGGAKDRPARQYRALYNGTFFHLRMHMMFDALHEKGLIRTLYAEYRAYEPGLKLSGTVDRVVEFEWNGKTIRAVIDYKSAKRVDFDALVEPQWDHARQQHAYGLLAHNADVWVMLYECKDSNDFKIYDRQYSEEMYAALIRDYRLADRWVDRFKEGGDNETDGPVPAREDLPVLPLVTKWCRYCPWNVACLELRPDRPNVKSADGS